MTFTRRLLSDGKLLTEALYLTCFACYVIFFYLQTTTFDMSVPGGIYSIIRGLLLLTALYRINIFREDLGLTRGIAVAAFAGLGLFYFISRGDVFVLDAALLTAGACQVSFKRIGMIYLFAGSFISLLALVCSQTGIIIDYTFLTNYGADERIRHSLGIIYPTDCYAHVFYLVAVYCMLRWKRIRLIELAGAGALLTLVYYYTSARADMAAGALMIIMVLAVKLLISRKKDLTMAFKKIISVMLMPVCAAVIFALTYLYDTGKPLMLKLDSWMSYRLSLGKTGMNLYGFTFLGAPDFAENGNSNGGIRNYTYVFYDSAYVKYLLKYGVLLLAVLFAVYALIGLRLASSKCFYGMVFISVTALSFIIEHHMLELSYNITLLLLTADISTFLHNDPYININKRNGIITS